MFLKDLSKINADMVDGKHAENSANNIPVLDSNAKLPIAQIPTGTTSTTVSLGNHNHDNTYTKPTGTITANRVAVFNDTTGRVIKDSGYTIATSVPSGAKFTDTVYTHPNDANTRHVTDAEKSTWNAKESTSGSQAKADAALASAKSYTDEKLAELVDSSPETLDTLNELAAALGNDANFATTVAEQIGTKADTTYVNTELAKKAASSHTHNYAGSSSAGGSANSAVKLATARTLSATGDATGSMSFDGSANASMALTLSNSGVTSGSYGPSANATATHGGTISVPQVTVDAKGRVTSASTKTITLPSNPNTDTKVTNTLNTKAKAYITGTTSATTNTGTQVFDTGVYLDETEGKLVATTFQGSLAGNATTATSATSATKATQDSAGQQINTTYIKGLSVSGKTITYTKGDGTTGTITTQDTNTTYSTGTDTVSGLTKLYTEAGTNTDGTMTQDAITTALNEKAASSHTHNYAGSSSAGGAANSAVKLSTARTINGTSFDGSANITTANWGTARNITISDSDGTNTGSAVSVNGSANATLKLPATIKANLSGNATTATTATSATSATKATQDSAGQQINSTYIKGLSVSGKVITYTKGDGTTATITTQDTDTHHTAKNIVGASNTATANATSSNGSTYMNLIENGAVRSAHKISGSGATTVSSDASGNITISSTDTNTTYTAGTGMALSGTTFNHKNSVAAGTAQGDDSKTLTWGGTFTIPTVTYDEQGHITGKGTTTMTMPSNPNSDTKVTNTLNTTTKAYITGTTSATTNTGTQVFDTGVYLDTTAGMLTATTFKGNLSGNATSATTATSATSATSATKATQDSAGQQINSTYIKGLSVSGKTITYTKGDGTTGTITTQDTNTTYSTGTASALGLTKLYTGTGTATDGTMTQAAINTALSGKASSSHTHSYLPLSGGTITSSEFGPLKVNRNGSTNGASIEFSNDNGTLGYIGMNGEENGGLVRYSADTTTSYTVLDTGNYKNTVTPANIGAAASSHTHNYAGSSSAGGAANSATKLATARTINGTSFDGSANITTANWGTARNIYIADSDATNTGSAVSVNGSGNATLKLPATIKASLTGNATTATQLQNARTIAISGGASGGATSFNGTSNISIPITSVSESYLSWGGKNLAGSFGPIDAAMVPDLGANRLAFMPSAGVVIEYSTDGGTTWATYSTSDANKINLFNGNSASHVIGASTATEIDKTNYMLRVTITASTAKVYTVLNKFVIYCSTNGSTGSYCTITARTQANVTAGTDTWTTFANKISISGWSGYNVINTSGITVGTGSSQYGQLRFTFGVTSHASTVAYAGLNIMSIMGFGGVGWTTPSTMASKGRMYTYDASQNVTFPAKVTATGFTGPLTGNASTATTLATARTINGTSFNGSANITTANWGTARTLSWTGDATGSMSVNGSANVSAALTLANSGVTAGSYGPSANATLTWGGTFTVPQATVDAKGRVTGATTRTFTMPANPNSDTKVTNTLGTTTKAYVTGTTSATTNTGTQIFDTGVYLDTTAGMLTATTFKGALSGNATTATTLATARTINGTSFNGSANITTANWGTARTITIGSTGKSVNGSANVSWTLDEIGAAAASHTHSYLPLSGGTLTGRLTASGKISAPTTGGSWINGMTLTNATLAITTQQTTSSYHPILAVQTSGGHVANIGGLGDNFGFYGFKSGRTENATDWSFAINASSGAITATGKITASGGFAGALTGNATTATTLQTARTINGTSFNGSANITTANWGTARTIYIADNAGSNTGTGVSVNGSANATLKLPATIAASLSGNATTATTLQTARTINGTSFNGSANITTANWGTARTITIGSTGKSVNGSTNVSWTLAEIGAVPLAGGTMTGNLNLKNETYVRATTTGGDVYEVLGFTSTNAFIVGSPSGATTLRSSNNPRVMVGSSIYEIYHKGYKPTLSEIGAAASSHNHTSLTSISSLTFSTSAVISAASGGVKVSSSYITMGGGTLMQVTSDTLETKAISATTIAASGTATFAKTATFSDAINGVGNISLNNASLYCGTVNSTLTCSYLRFNKNIIASDDSKRIHLLDTGGSPANIYANSLTSKQTYAEVMWSDCGDVLDTEINENVRLIKTSEVQTIDDLDIINENTDTLDMSNDITTPEMFDFIKNKLSLYSYNEIQSESDKSIGAKTINTDTNKIGFVTSEIANNKVGRNFIKEREGKLAYNLNNYVLLLTGALQEEIKKREALEERLAKLEEAIN